MAITFFKTIHSSKQALLDPGIKKTDAPISSSSKSDSLFTRTLSQKLTYAQMELMYDLNIWVKSAIDKKIQTAASVDPVVRYILEDEKTAPTAKQRKRADEIRQLIRKPNTMKISFSNIVKAVLRDSNIYDAGAIEWIRVKNQEKKKIVEMFPVAGETVRLNLNKYGVFKDFNKAYSQVDLDGEEVANFASNELCYMIQHPQSGTPYGKSDLETLAMTVAAELHASDFNFQRFLNEATPKFAVLINGAGIEQGGPIIRRFQRYWENEIKGNPHKPIFLSTDTGEIKLQKTGLTNQEMEYQAYSMWLMSKIATVLNVPPFVMGVIDSSTGKLNSKEQHNVFKRTAVYPQLNTFSWHFNTEVIWADDSYNYDDIYLDWNAIDISDKKELSAIHKDYLQTGVLTINNVLDELGKSRVPWGDKPFVQKQYVPIDLLGNESSPNNDLPPTSKSKGITGLEHVEPSRIKEALTSLLKKREKVLNKFYLIPENVGAKNNA